MKIPSRRRAKLPDGGVSSSDLALVLRGLRRRPVRGDASRGPVTSRQVVSGGIAGGSCHKLDRPSPGDGRASARNLRGFKRSFTAVRTAADGRSDQAVRAGRSRAYKSPKTVATGPTAFAYGVPTRGHQRHWSDLSDDPPERVSAAGPHARRPLTRHLARPRAAATPADRRRRRAVALRRGRPAGAGRRHPAPALAPAARRSARARAGVRVRLVHRLGGPRGHAPAAPAGLPRGWPHIVFAGRRTPALEAGAAIDAYAGPERPLAWIDDAPRRGLHGRGPRHAAARPARDAPIRESA